MTLPVSTSCRESGVGDVDRSAVKGGVAGDLALPAAPDDAGPGAGEDSDGVGMVLAGRSGLVDVRRTGLAWRLLSA
jgi:hypothetical protein